MVLSAAFALYIELSLYEHMIFPIFNLLILFPSPPGESEWVSSWVKLKLATSVYLQPRSNLACAPNTFFTIFTKLKCYMMCLKTSKISSWESPCIRLSPTPSSMLTNIIFSFVRPGRLSCWMLLEKVFNCMGHATSQWIIPSFCSNAQTISKLKFWRVINPEHKSEPLGFKIKIRKGNVTLTFSLFNIRAHQHLLKINVNSSCPCKLWISSCGRNY